MTYITCDHPSDKVHVKKEIIKTTDLLIKYEKPRPYCENCETYLPEHEKKTIAIINFFFVRQDNLVRALVTS